MTRRDSLVLVLLSAIWGASFLFIKLGVEEVEPFVVVFGRMMVGAAILLPLLARQHGLGVLRGNLAPVAVLAVVNNVVPSWLLAFAETRIDSGLAGVLQAAAPIFTVVIAARVVPSQRVSGLRLAGLGLGFVGVALLVGIQQGGQLIGALAVIAAALCYAAAVLYAGVALRVLPPLQIAAGQLATAAVLSAPIGLIQLPHSAPSWKAISAIVALGALGSGVAYLLYFRLIASAGASRAILVTYLVPAFALLYGAVFLDEPITAAAVAGLGLVLAGTALATETWRPKRTARRRRHREK